MFKDHTSIELDMQIAGETKAGSMVGDLPPTLPVGILLRRIAGKERGPRRLIRRTPFGVRASPTKGAAERSVR